MTRRRKIVLFLFGGLGLLWFWYGGTHVRYILAVEIEVDGQRRTASSAIAVDYYPEAIFRLGPGTGGPAYIKGISPTFDLGERGTLFAALQGDTTAYVRVYKNWAAATAIDLPIVAYGLDVHSVWRVRWQGTVEVQPKHYPGFIWMPATQNWRDAKQMKYFDVPNIVSPSVRVTKVTLTPRYWSSVKTKIEPAPEWLIDLREKPNRSILVSPDRFNFSNTFIESYSAYDPYRGLR